MKSRNTAVKVAAGMLCICLILLAWPVAAQEGGQPNLLANPGFEEGHYNQDGIAEITVPNGWRLHWLDDVTFPGAFNNLEAYRPESVVWNVNGAPPHEVDLFWRDGIYTLKIFKSWAPVYAALSQDVTGLEMGRRYRLVAPVYVDIFDDIKDGQKVPPDFIDSGRVRLGAGPTGVGWRDESQISYSGWWSGSSISPFYLAYPTFIHEFTAVSPNMTVWIEVASIYPHPNNGFFMDTIGLYALNEVDNSASAAPVAAAPAGGQPAPAPQAPAAPVPTAEPRADGSVVHVVQSGDSFWTIAIRYAQTLGLTPEEALPAIIELNDNPTFINVGQELLIVPPGQAIDLSADEEDIEVVDEESAETTATEDEAAQDEAAEPEESLSAAEAVEADDVELPGTICVTAFHDEDRDGVFNTGSESLLANAAVTLARGGNTVTTYVTDGVGEPYCFENLEPTTYQVQVFPPADHQMTTDGSWAIVAGAGVSIPIEIGAVFEPVVAESVDTASAEAEVAVAEPEADGGLTSNLGAIVIGVAVLLVILAGAGVILLRRA